MTKILLIQGANMAWLGRRQPEIYGTVAAAELDRRLLAMAQARAIDLEILYTHLEGEAIARIYRAVDDGTLGLVMNPAGFSYGGHALRDCLLGCDSLPYIEVHLSNLGKRGIRSITAPAALGVIAGFGVECYVLALDAMRALLATRAKRE